MPSTLVTEISYLVEVIRIKRRRQVFTLELIENSLFLVRG